MTPAHALLEEAHAAGCVVRLKDGRPNVAGSPSTELLACLRAHKAEIVALLSGDICRYCGEPMRWPEPCSVVYGDGTAEHHSCRLLVAAERAVTGVVGTSDNGELLHAGDDA